MRAKFKLMEKTETTYGGKVRLEPVTGGSKENEEFFKWTPYGSIDVGTINDNVLKNMIVGKEYFVDFTLAE